MVISSAVESEAEDFADTNNVDDDIVVFGLIWSSKEEELMNSPVGLFYEE